MTDFFPEITPYDHFLLEVGQLHRVYVEQCGNPDGEPILFVHGGPGEVVPKMTADFLTQSDIVLFCLISGGAVAPYLMDYWKTIRHKI